MTKIKYINYIQGNKGNKIQHEVRQYCCQSQNSKLFNILSKLGIISQKLAEFFEILPDFGSKSDRG